MVGYGTCRTAIGCFNPLPSPKRGEIRSSGSLAPMKSFQSAPLTEARGDVATSACGSRCFVSIRSPHRSEGRFRGDAEAISKLLMFQSAPLTEARGDLESLGLPDVDPGFNPLPSPKRGEIDGSTQGRDLVHVSIRSPHRSEGRLRGRTTGKSYLARFQSAPLTEARGDHEYHLRGRHLCRFNPLPSPKRGEISLPALPVSILLFQSAPLTEARGDKTDKQARTLLLKFQSAPLTEARGDQATALRSAIGAQFQSAPLTEARGDDAGSTD